MIDFLPAEARTHERAVLICYHVLGIKNVRDLQVILNHKYPSEIYRTLRKFRNVPFDYEGYNLQRVRTSYVAPVGFKNISSS